MHDCRLNAESTANLLQRMCLNVEIAADQQTLKVSSPPTRHDIIHEFDVVEDVAIAYGYNNINMVFPSTHCIAQQVWRIKKNDVLFSSKDDVSQKLRQPNGCDPAVHIGSPKTLEFEVFLNKALAVLVSCGSSYTQYR